MRTNRFAGALYAIVFMIGCAGCSSIPSWIGDPVYRSDDYIIYRMKKGDTTVGLAERFLGDSKLLWRIVEANASLEPERLITIPLKAGNKGGIFENGIQQVPILCYHRFGTDCASPLCLPEDAFERQMRYLKENGFHTVRPEQMLAFLEYREALPKKSVMITVDDGYSSFYEIAFPILQRYEFTATLFVYVDFIGVSGKALSWEQLRQLKAWGISIGSHTMMHSDLSKRAENETEEAYLRRLRKECSESKRIIDARLGQDTFIFAYPFGRANGIAMRNAYEAGYKLAVTVRRGSNPFFADPYNLQRDQIMGRDLTTFVSRLKTFHSLSLR